MYCTFCGKENPSSFVFCNACGKKKEDLVRDEHTDKNTINNFSEIATAIQLSFGGRDGKQVEQLLAKSIAHKSGGRTLYNLYASKSYLIVLPATKDKGGIALFGLLLGGGALAAAAMGALDALSKKLENKDAMTTAAGEDALTSALVFAKESIRLSAKEIRAGDFDPFDPFKKETWILVTGIGLFNNRNYELSIKFGFEGQVTNPKKPKLKALDLLCSSLNISPPLVHTGKNAPF